MRIDAFKYNLIFSKNIKPILNRLSRASCKGGSVLYNRVTKWYFSGINSVILKYYIKLQTKEISQIKLGLFLHMHQQNIHLRLKKLLPKAISICKKLTPDFVQNTIKELPKVLSRVQTLVYYYRIGGYNLYEISKCLNTSKPYITIVYKNIYKKLEYYSTCQSTKVDIEKIKEIKEFLNILDEPVWMKKSKISMVKSEINHKY